MEAKCAVLTFLTGNGPERDFLNDGNVYIMDVYNKDHLEDQIAKHAIKCNVALNPHTSNAEYLEKVERNLEKSLQEFNPDIMVYVAGTNILIGDERGNLDITPEGVIQRDAIVFKKARENGVPIVMLTDGGVAKSAAETVAKSILNLQTLNLISK